MIEVHPGEAADIPGLLALEAEFEASGLPQWQLLDDVAFARKIARGELLVAHDDAVAGFLTWTTLWRMPWIEFVRVRAQMRRRGIGSALVRALETRLRAADGSFLVSSTSEGEEASIAWHTAIGFERGGRIEWLMWPGAPDEIVFSKRL